MGWHRGQTYAQDLRDRVLSLDHLSARAVAARLSVSVSYVIKARQRRARTGMVTPRPQKPPVARKLVHLHDALRDRMAQAGDATLAEHKEWLAETHGVTAGLSTIWKTLSRLGFTLKKSPFGRPSRCAPMSPKPVVSGRSCSPSST
jgi:transposase